MKLDLLITDMKTWVPCKFEMLSFNKALVIKYYVWFAFLFIQTVVKLGFTGVNIIFLIFALRTASVF